MRRLLYFWILAALVTGMAAAETNITGKWTGAFHSIGPEGEARESTAVLIQQTGTEVTGTVGPTDSDQHMAVKGKIDGSRITLAAEDEGRAVKFDLVLAADRITGDMSMVHSGQTAKAKINVTRAK